MEPAACYKLTVFSHILNQTYDRAANLWTYFPTPFTPSAPAGKP